MRIPVVFSAFVLFAPTVVAGSPVQIAPGVHLLRGDFAPGRQPDGNSVIFDAPEGLVIVDTGRHRAHTQALLDFAVSRRKPIVAVINTHWHLDHVGGNVLLRQESANLRVYASGALDDALKGFLARYAEQLRAAIAKSADREEQQRYRTELALIEGGPKLRPDSLLASSGPKKIAGRMLALNVQQYAATAADVWVVDQRTRTVVAGDLITLPFPFFDTACPAGWTAALDRLGREKFKLVVPGHGAVMTRPSFQKYRSAFKSLLRCAGSERSADQCAEGWISDAGDLISAEQHDFARDGVKYYLENHLRSAPEKTAERCGT